MKIHQANIPQVKKSIVFILLMALCTPSFCLATNYYISNSGNDDNSGTTPAAAWRTIRKLNIAFSSIHAGDSILFKRGESFYGTITVTVSGRAGAPIVFSAYGKGSNPVITGLVPVKGWQKKQGNVWESAATGIHNDLNMVLVNGSAQRVGRYPNADAPDGGYLRYGNALAPTAIIDSSLSAATDWTGAEVVVRKNHWTAERCKITLQEGNKLMFTNAFAAINTSTPPKLYDGLRGNGYFFQRDARTLDQQGEWYFDNASSKLQVYLTDTNHVVKAAAADTLVNTGGNGWLSFSQLDFEGANMSAVYNKNGDYITITHCNFNNIGAKAIHFWGTGNVLIEDDHFNHVLSNSIQVRTSKKDNVTVRNCVVKNNGMFLGMGSFFDDRDYKALSVSALNNVLVEDNIIDSTGLSGIQFQGNNVLIQHNLVNHFCQVLDDGAGIYTFVELTKDNAGENFTNRVVRNNIILNGRGAPEGSVKIYKAEGIYLDGRTMNVEITGNSIANNGNKAFACNNPVNVTIRDNDCFNNGGGWGANRTINWQDIRNFQVRNNIFYSLTNQQGLVNFSHSGLDVPEKVTIWEAIRLMGDIDSNYYNTANPVAFVYNYAPVAGKPALYPSPLTFENWKEFTGQDAHSRQPAKVLPPFVFRSNTSGNLIANGSFNEDTRGINLFGSGAKGEWDGTEKITGKGSLKIECTLPQPNRYILVHGNAGNLKAGKNYMLRFKTFGTSDCGIVKGYLRKTAAPYTILSKVQLQSFGLGKKEHEFLLSPGSSEAADFAIEIEKNSCTAYLDDIELHEADATAINLPDHVRFEYNATGKSIEIPLGKNYVGVDGTKFSGTLTLPPYTSKILIEEGGF